MVTIRIREEQFLVRRCLVGIYFRAHKDPEWNEGKKSLTVCLENHLTFEFFFFFFMTQPAYNVWFDRTPALFFPSKL